MSAHSVPLHCPYCAGESLHPHGDRHGAWECRECLRAFSVSFIGLLAQGRATAPRQTGTSATGGLQ
jgi:transposase-like protein